MNGTLKLMVSEIEETQEVGQNNFKKRVLWGKDEGSQWPQEWKVEFVKDKVSLLDDILEGTFVTISYNLRSNVVVKDDGTKMNFVTIQGWKIEV